MPPEEEIFIQRKALYNLIQLNLNRLSEGVEFSELQNWQTENYREKPLEELFLRLNSLKIPLDLSEFEGYGKNFESPEEIVELLAKEKEPQIQDQIYLVVFELFRRLFPEKRSLSIFCDELDYQIMNYDLGKLKKTEELQDTLAYLQQILDENVDTGLDPKLSFQIIQTFCANDIESFLFDYILEQVEEKNNTYASELIEGFDRYIEKRDWFDYLKARVAIAEDPEEGYDQLEKLVLRLDSETSLDLIEEILYFLANSGNHSLFYMAAKKSIKFLHIEAHFRELLEICYLHYDYLELKWPAFAISEIYYKRKDILKEQPLLQSDPDLIKLHQILDQKVTFATEG